MSKTDPIAKMVDGYLPVILEEFPIDVDGVWGSSTWLHVSGGWPRWAMLWGSQRGSAHSVTLHGGFDHASTGWPRAQSCLGSLAQSFTSISLLANSAICAVLLNGWIQFWLCHIWFCLNMSNLLVNRRRSRSAKRCCLRHTQYLLGSHYSKRMEGGYVLPGLDTGWVCCVGVSMWKRLNFTQTWVNQVKVCCTKLTVSG